MEIAPILKELRHKKGLSQDALAKEVGTKLSAISRWERGDVKPNLEMATKLAKALQVSMDVFCGLTTNNTSSLEKLAKQANTLPNDQIKTLEMILKQFLKP